MANIPAISFISLCWRVCRGSRREVLITLKFVHKTMSRWSQRVITINYQDNRPNRFQTWWRRREMEKTSILTCKLMNLTEATFVLVCFKVQIFKTKNKCAFQLIAKRDLIHVIPPQSVSHNHPCPLDVHVRVKTADSWKKNLCTKLIIWRLSSCTCRHL